MRIWILMTCRELKSYFHALTGYIIITFFLLMYGYNFWFLLTVFGNPQNNFTETFTTFYFGTFFYWIVLLLIPPVLTMQSIAKERESGTLELVLSAPVSCAKVIAAKFTAALLFYTIMWSITALHFLLISQNGICTTPVIFSSYLGTFLIGAVFLSIGIFASVLVRNQLISVTVAIGLGALFFSIGFMSYIVMDEPIKSILNYINILEHTYRFTEGIIDSRALVYCTSLTFLFLFLSTKVLQAERWR